MLFRMHGTYSMEATKFEEAKFLEACGKPQDGGSWWQPSFQHLPNVKFITENDFWWSTMQKGARAEAWLGHQPNKHNFVNKDGKHVSDWVDCILYWDNHDRLIGGGHGVLWSYNQKTTLYFTWQACDHKWEEHSPRMFSHVVTCQKCKAVYEYDSS